MKPRVFFAELRANPLHTMLIAFIISRAFIRTGIVGIPAVLILFVLKLLRVPDEIRSRFIWWCAQKFWAPYISRLASVKYRILGLEKIDWSRRYIIVATHKSVFDFFPLIINVPRGVMSAKADYVKAPVIGQAIMLGGQCVLKTQRKGVSMSALRESVAKHKRSNIIIFAEGTRVTLERAGHYETADFKMGAFKLALETGLPILPVAIAGTSRVLARGPFMRLQLNQPVYIEFGNPIFCDQKQMTAEELARHTRSKIDLMLQRGQGEIEKKSTMSHSLPAKEQIWRCQESCEYRANKRASG